MHLRTSRRPNSETQGHLCYGRLRRGAFAAGVYAAVDVWDARAAGVAGIVTAVVAHFGAQWLGLRTRRAEGAAGLLLTRSKK